MCDWCAFVRTVLDFNAGRVCTRCMIRDIVDQNKSTESGTMLFCFVVVVVNAILLQIAAEEAVLENSFVSFTFDSSKGFTKLTDKRSGLDAIGTAAGSVSIWEFQLVDKVGELTVELPQNAQFVSTKDEAGKSSTLNMAWNSIDVLRGNTFVANVNVTLNVVLPDASSVAELELSLAVNSGDAVGVWDGVVSVPLSIASDPDGELFFPSGFGHTFTEPAASTGGNYASTYPGGMCTMQFIAMGNTKASSGVYMAALDSAGQGKGLQYSTFASSLKPDPSHHVLHGSKGKKMVAPVRRWSASASDGDAALSMTIFPPNAGLPLALGATWTAPYKLAIGVLQDVSSDQGRPLWAEAAQQYRQWALQHADWTRPGTLAEREEKKLKQEAALSKNVPVPPMPAWYRTNTLWLNTHWQCHDIFNATGGDPHFVLPYTLEVAEHLWGSDPATPRSMALHWYEWQQGPDPAPEARYLFDTHYPDYFPSRTDFKSAVQELRKRGIQSFPYINGRISDVNSISYAADNGALYCSKAAPARLVLPDSQQELTPYVETYGSNATFCVTNPFTPYWQQKLADTVKELVDDYGCPGVYIDQIGSAIPKLCWDATHGHTLGGGNFWTTGYQGMMDAISTSLYQQRSQQQAAGYPMVTEDNAEPYMGMVQGFLTLDAFKLSLAQTASADIPPDARMSPAYPMIYGGYYVGFGAIWTRADFGDHDWWCSKLSAMLVTGSQLGWFSLAGVAEDSADSCGPMGVGDLFMDPASDDLVAFLQLLSRTRAAVVDFVSDGSLLRPPSLSPAAPVHVFTSDFDGAQQAYDTVLLQAWRLDKGHGHSSLLVLVVNAAQVGYSGDVVIRPSNWGVYAEDLVAAAVDGFTAASADAASAARPTKQNPSLQSADGVKVPVALAGRSVQVLEFHL